MPPFVDLDPQTADRILAGVVACDDVPSGFGDVVRLVDAAALGEQIVEAIAGRTATAMAAVVVWLRGDPASPGRAHGRRPVFVPPGWIGGEQP